MNRDSITGQLTTTWAARHLDYLAQTVSTQEDAKALAGTGAPHGTLVVTDDQTAGRGRGVRVWSCPPGSNIAMSLILRPTLPVTQMPSLTLMAGLAVAQGIADLLPEEWRDRILIKWPNDVVIEKRKVCGILTEAMLRPDGTVDACIVGIGINVRQTEFPEELREIAGSILSQTGIRVSRSALIASFCRRLEACYERYLTAGSLAALRESYEERLINRDAPVRILEPDGEWTGTAQGIDDNGALLVTAADGTRHAIAAGEVSVRGLYHYMD